jgi:uncharacterized protein YcaQ
MLEVAGSLCGLHAQLMSSAELTLWARVDGIRRADVAEALWESRSLFKTWAMRGTLHVLPSSEYGMWQSGWGTYDHYLKGAWFKNFGMSREELEGIIDAVGTCLEGKVLTREELAARVAERLGSPELGDKLRQSWGAMLKPASFRGQLCFGPNRARNVTFTHPRTWLDAGPAMEGRRALSEITRRFLVANGPATREDYARWWFMSPAKAGRLLEGLEDAVRVQGTGCWMLAADLAEAESNGRVETVRLLPGFDQFVIAATLHADRLLSGSYKPRIYRPQGWISPVVLVDGRMAGVWEYEKKPARLAVTVEPFGALSAGAKKGVKAEAESLAAFLGASDVELQFAG